MFSPLKILIVAAIWNFLKLLLGNSNYIGCASDPDACNRISAKKKTKRLLSCSTVLAQQYGYFLTMH